MRRILAWTMLVAALAAVPASAQERADRKNMDVAGTHEDAVFAAARSVTVEARIGDDLVAAGGVIAIVKSQVEDLFAAGGSVTVDGSSAQNLFVVGGSVDFSGVTADDLVVAGGAIGVTAEVRDDLLAAGGRVRTSSGLRVGGTGRLAGGDLGIEGTFAKDLYLAGGAIRLDAVVGGNVEIRGGTVTLGPATRIAGTLRYAADDPPHLVAGAVVTGGMERLPRAARGFDVDTGDIVAGFILFCLAVFAGMFLVAIAVLAVIPGLLSDTQARLAERPWESLGIGIAVAILVPPLLALLAVTLVGLPLAVLVGLLYVPIGVIAFAVLAYRIGLWVRRRITGDAAEPDTWLWKSLWALAGAGAIGLVLLVPFVGWAVVLVALAAAFGALLIETRRALA